MWTSLVRAAKRELAWAGLAAPLLFWLHGCDGRFRPDLECSDRRLPYEILADGQDNDCDGETDEGLPASRAHCGAIGRSCTLPPGAADVECIDGQCTGITPPAGPRPAEAANECLDGLDNDGDGVRDNGPACEVLVANVSSTACHGAARRDDPRCPPTAFVMGRDLRGTGREGLDETPQRFVYLTYDYYVDRHETTRGQYARYLDDTQGSARCPDPQDFRCTGEEEPQTLPVTGLTWCEASRYCRWAGKRLPTEAEWERMARGAGPVGRNFPWDGTMKTGAACVDGAHDCDFGAVVSSCCSPTGPVSVDTPGGRALVGDELIEHVGGNLWEWVYDWFTGSYAGLAGTTPFDRVQQRVPYEGHEWHILRGGGFDWKLDSAETVNRRPVDRKLALESFGVRCARDFEQGPPPFEQELPGEEDCLSPGGLGDPVQGEQILVALDWCPREMMHQSLLMQPIINPWLEKASHCLTLALRHGAAGEQVAALGMAQVAGAEEETLACLKRAEDGLSWQASRAAAEGRGPACDSGWCAGISWPEERARLDLEVMRTLPPLPLEIRDVEPLDEDQRRCPARAYGDSLLAPAPDDLLLLVHTELRRTDLMGMEMGRALIEVLCNHHDNCEEIAQGRPGNGLGLCCTDPPLPLDCNTECQAWSVDFEARFRRVAGSAP